MILLNTEEFDKKFLDLPKAIQKKALKQQIIFSKNPYHPSLHTEKLSPKEKGIWSFRIDRKYRILFRFIDARIVLLLSAGPHSWIYRISK